MPDNDSIFSDKDVFKDVREAYAQYKGAADREHKSHVELYDYTKSDAISKMYWSIMRISSQANEIPKRGTYAYMEWLDTIWKEEPILAGAVYSMVARMQSMTWTVEGGRNNTSRVASMLARAQFFGGNNWAGFMGNSAIDFYVQDNGVWWDTYRVGGHQWGRLIDLSHIDTRCCVFTGNADKPMYYRSSLIGEDRWYRPGEFIHFLSMPQPDQREVGMGYCAVSRAARAAKLLMALHDYDAEKLANLPPEGVASVTGLTDREFRQAVTMWQAERKKKNSLTFPQVLWLIGNNPGAKVSVDMTPFSTIPESFDRQTIVSQYVNTLALCFGVDTREFWAISTGALGTASEAEVQHLKARGKGGGEFISMAEAALNAELPDDVVFKFDTQDIEEDMVAATVAKAWIDAYLPLVFPTSEGAESIIDAKTFKRLMADKGVLPEWAVGDDRIAITAHQIHKDEMYDIVKFIWEMGKMRSVTLISMAATAQKDLKLPTSTGNIRGKPISDDEVDRGVRMTSRTGDAIQELWGDIPELSVHVPSEET